MITNEGKRICDKEIHSRSHAALVEACLSGLDTQQLNMVATMKDAKGYGSDQRGETAHQADVVAVGQEQRFHLGFKYRNPEKGWENSGNAVVFHTHIEGAAQRLMAERNIPSMFVTNRYHANGRVDDINREFQNPSYRAPPTPLKRKR